MKNYRNVSLAMLFCATASFGDVCAQSLAKERTEIGQSATEASTGNVKNAVEISFVCKFNSGPLAGRIENLSSRAGQLALPAGGACSDGTSSGVTVTDVSGTKDPANWNGAITSRSANRRTSTICQFMSGPKAHGWHDFAPFPAAPVESVCDDGEGSVGFVQSAGHGDRY